MYYDNSVFPWLPAFEENWEKIRDEVIAIGDEGFLPWPEREYYNFGWKVFGLYGFGVRFDKHCDMCPVTSSLIEKIPGVENAGFSRMNPYTHIKAHRNGAPEGVLRLHVPLIVPEGCVFRVEDSYRTWTEGECFVFDDCLDHEAWNRSDKNRIVLLVDFPATDLVHYPSVRHKTKRFLNRLAGIPTEYNYLPAGKTKEEVMVQPPAMAT
jgi:aspartyl/asparaginyl beta-hydroxylase (cupin superfamily)